MATKTKTKPTNNKNLPVHPRTETRRTDKAADSKSDKKKVAKRKSLKQDQKELFAKRSPKHDEIFKLAKDQHDAQTQMGIWQEYRDAAEIKLTAMFKKEGITGPYKAGEYVCKPRHTQAKDSVKIEKKGGDDDE